MSVARSASSTSTVPTAARAPDSPRFSASSTNSAMAPAPPEGSTALTKIEANTSGTNERVRLCTPTTRKP